MPAGEGCLQQHWEWVALDWGGRSGLQISREARLKLGSPAGGMRGMCHVGLVTGAQRRGREHSPGQQWGSDAGRWDVPGPRLAGTQGPL